MELDHCGDSAYHLRVQEGLNLRGSLDLAVANKGGELNVLYLNDGTGYFQKATDLSGIGAASNSVAIATADFNNDASSDLYVVNANLPDQLYLNNGPNGAGCW